MTSRTHRYLDERSAAARERIAASAEDAGVCALSACEKAAADRPLVALGIAAGAGALLVSSLRRVGGTMTLRSALRLRRLLSLS